MKIKNLIEKNKYALASFAVLATLSTIFSGFDDPVILALRLLVCVCSALFFSLCVKKEDDIYLSAFFLLALISSNVIFLTEDIHILLSVSFFLLSLAFSEKLKYLSPVFAALCILFQPLTIAFFAPTIIITLLFKKHNIPAVISALSCAGAFVFTKAAENSEFYAEQFSSYHLNLHLVHFSNVHIENLSAFLIASIPLLAVILFIIIKSVIDKNFLIAVSTVISFLSALYGFALSKNLETVILILVPVFAFLLCVSDKKGFEKTFNSFNDFFKKRILLFLLIIAFVASFPLVFGSVPYEEDFFSKITFIIFRQE
ncbi:MAG: hypothetical protein IK955_05595 [Clostridia bacterium]|nr:hypothetical protein [Clostridia bacterium]